MILKKNILNNKILFKYKKLNNIHSSVIGIHEHLQQNFLKNM